MAHSLDTQLLLLINGHHNSFFDFVFWWASDRFIWIPFYIVLLLLFYKQFQNKIWVILVAVVAMILLSDQTAGFFKEYMQQLRPCHTPALQGLLHGVNNYCGGPFSYISSHASNSVSLTLFCFLLIDKEIKWVRFALVLYTTLICYSRVYLGSHFPSDILRGIILGCICGYLASTMVKQMVKKKSLN